MPSLRTSILLAAALLAGACTPAAAPSYPAGTVLVMDGEPILQTEIDALAGALSDLGPQYTEPHRRRVILTRLLLPRARARHLYPDAREAALARLAGRRAEIDSGAEPQIVEGDESVIGLSTWLALREAPIGEWTETFEGPGAVAQAKLISRDGHPNPSTEYFVCWLNYEEYAGPEFSIEPTQLGGTLEIVAEDAETWRAVLPTRWLFELEERTQ